MTRPLRAAAQAAAPAPDTSSRGDEGSGSVLALAIIGVIAALTLAGALLGGVVHATHRARSAADLAALAAAGALSGPGGGDPCARARATAEANGARLVGCVVEGLEARVAVTVPVTGPPARFGPARAQARAGPGR